jgi:hypothetical protein
VRREFTQRLYVVLHGALGSYLYDALHGQEGDVDVAACLPGPRA